ncbi:hypothetical protein SCP_0106110 [Sparassis crispa]|uniref:WHIM1 domain-containing protein n=1 Tax=Sparassis crispa TaxID=139825 RepID=A0A401G6E8_9APHY|nr:hypothetical protein SCP_0106110 [Sparassis crispa]GBE77729.1 hypothetical protein SCP_0106110 [Sparassis crispa]
MEMHQDSTSEKRGHICPPSNATHPSDRWESLFVYGFICKFTQLRSKVEGLDSPMDFEEALLSNEPNPVMTQILSRFVLNLRPQTRNVSSDVISSTVVTVLQDYLKSSERTVFWDEELKTNVDPFHGMAQGFFAAHWDLKLKVLRQLVELQLSHSPAVKNIIDRAWGVVHNKHKKTETPAVPPPPGDPLSQEALQLIPLGQDTDRKRYWVIDDSPRLYLSTNPWKITATFQTIASTREEYMAIVDKVKESAPSEPKPGERRTKLELAHLALLKALQDRMEVIDAELTRLHRARRKIEQRNLLIAQAEVRETRTRRRTTRPDYAYMNDPISEDDQDEYTYQEQEDDEYEDQMEYDDLSGYRGDPSTSRRAAAGAGRRRSTRTSNGDGKRTADEWAEWRGERRSTRLGAPAETQLDNALPTRARTVDSTVSTNSAEGTPAQAPSGLKIKIHGAAAMKPTETAVEVVAGKKKSKYWYYAVEPVAAVASAPPPPSDYASTSYHDAGSSATNGSRYGGGSETSEVNGHDKNGDMELYEKSLEGSLSPASSMDES